MVGARTYSPHDRNAIEIPRGNAVTTTSNFIISFWCCGLVLLGFMLSSNEFWHWFVMPVYLCGALIGGDAVAWFRRQVDVLGPIGILGLLGVHFFFLAPLLHISWDHWNFFRIEPSDWRPWLGWMAVLNLVGISTYLAARGVALRVDGPERSTSEWSLRQDVFKRLVAVALAVTGVVQILVYVSFGGVSGYVNQIGGDGFAGMGFVFMVAESFPILAFMAYAVSARNNPKLQSWSWVVCALIGFLILKLLFGGLRGSRSNTVWGVFWAVGIVHFWIRPISRGLVMAGLVGLFLFMYGYGYFERGELYLSGTDIGERDGAAVTEIAESPARRVALNDLARSDIQAYIVFRMNNGSLPYPDLALGRTYLGSALLIIPDWLFPGAKPPTKLLEGSELMVGPGAFEDRRLSSRVYALAGEAMFNFGVWGVPVAFAVWGIIVGTAVRAMKRWKSSDSRWLIAPLLVNLLFVLLASDSDNAVFFFVKNGAIPILVVMVSSRINPGTSLVWGKVDDRNRNLRAPILHRRL